jgi:P-type Ca2+ transporter type 2C
MNNTFDVLSHAGLSQLAAAAKLKQEGFNELPTSKKRSIFKIAFKIVSEPMFMFLIAGGVLYLVLGDLKEALMLLSFVFIIIGITVYQERKTERALEALRNLASPRASVIRDGEEINIPGREVVIDDLLIIREGNYIPADAYLLSSNNLLVDESLLTGEAVSVRKIAGSKVTQCLTPGGEDTPHIFSGTLAVRGYGIAKVIGIGLNTQIGKIGKALQSIVPERTLLQKMTDQLVRNLAIIGLSVCALVVVIYGLTRGNWLNGLLAGITLAMAILPEEFPVILSTFLAIGAWRISKKNVLTRRVPAVETLGSAKVLCVDKTGTLTLNAMSVSKLFANGSFYDATKAAAELPENFHELLEYGILAGEESPFDPMEKAIKKLGEQYLVKTEHIHHDWNLAYQYPLSKEMLALSHAWRASDKQDGYIIAAKGAPESIIDLCHLDQQQAKNIMAKVYAMADDGLRILGIAKARFKQEDLPKYQHDFNFEFIGLIGLSDPIRPMVPEAIRQCYKAGVRVIMITGDYPGTAQNIARQIGLEASDIITGAELTSMNDLELRQRIKTVNIFARIIPEQKLRIVNAVKANSEVVAMTGDGVNDAPALKAASIGIAMGGRGTDVAREAAELVLLDDDFSSIVTAIKMGRRIFDNIRKSMTYTLAIHIPIVGLSLLPLLFGWPLILLPMHIVFLELIIDPACSLAFEAEPAEPNIMEVPPRSPTEPLFNRKMVFFSLFQGCSALAFTLVMYFIGKWLGYDEAHIRTLMFSTLVFVNLTLIFANRSKKSSLITAIFSPNKTLWWVVGLALLLLSLVLTIPFLQSLFHFSAFHLFDLMIALGAGVLSIIWFELIKKFSRVC